MENLPAEALLREALELLNDRPNFSLRRDRRATSYRLAGRIDAYFALRDASPDLIENARRQFRDCDRLRFDAPTGPDVAQWVPAWVTLEGSVGLAGRRAAFDRALASLPPITREAFLAHRDRDLDYRAIATELGISIAEVERHIASALIRLDEALDQA